jgi:hypothetical protein
MKRRNLLYVLGVLVSLAINSCVTVPTITRPYSGETSGTSIGCGVGGGSLYQSFLADNTQVKSISLLLRAGGKYPSTGYTTHLILRDAIAYGAILAEADTFIAGPQDTGKQITVTFHFEVAPKVKIGKRYFIQWATPQEGGSVLTWLISTGNAYPDGEAFGCVSTPIQDNDFVFEVISQ